MTIETREIPPMPLHQPGLTTDIMQMVKAHQGELPMRIEETRANLGYLAVDRRLLGLEERMNQGLPTGAFCVARLWTDAKKGVNSARQLYGKAKLSRLSWLEGIENPGSIEDLPSVATFPRAQ